MDQGGFIIVSLHELSEGVNVGSSIDPKTERDPHVLFLQLNHKQPKFFPRDTGDLHVPAPFAGNVPLHLAAGPSRDVFRVSTFFGVGNIGGKLLI